MRYRLLYYSSAQMTITFLYFHLKYSNEDELHTHSSQWQEGNDIISLQNPAFYLHQSREKRAIRRHFT